MSKYYVSSGDFKVIVNSQNTKNAVVQAFSTQLTEDNNLGYVTLVSEKGFNSQNENDIWYDTIIILEETGQINKFTLKEWEE